MYKKKFLAGLLAAAMVVSGIPVHATEGGVAAEEGCTGNVQIESTVMSSDNYENWVAEGGQNGTRYLSNAFDGVLTGDWWHTKFNGGNPVVEVTTQMTGKNNIYLTLPESSTVDGLRYTANEENGFIIGCNVWTASENSTEEKNWEFVKKYLYTGEISNGLVLDWEFDIPKENVKYIKVEVLHAGGGCRFITGKDLSVYNNEVKIGGITAALDEGTGTHEGQGIENLVDVDEDGTADISTTFHTVWQDDDNFNELRPQYETGHFLIDNNKVFVSLKEEKDINAIEIIRRTDNVTNGAFTKAKIYVAKASEENTEAVTTAEGYEALTWECVAAPEEEWTYTNYRVKIDFDKIAEDVKYVQIEVLKSPTANISATEISLYEVTATSLGEHTYEDVAEIAATCTEVGMKAYSFCSLCGGKFVDEEGVLVQKTDAELETPALEHVYELQNAGTPTCTVGANGAYWLCTRENCGAMLADENGQQGGAIDAVPQLSPTGHLVTLVPGTPVTCLADGTADYYVCENEGCGLLFSDEAAENQIDSPEVIVSTGTEHSKTAVAEKAADCTSTGLRAHYKCTICEKLFETEASNEEISETELVIPMTAHQLTAVDEKEATCTKNGTKAYWVCSNDGCEACFNDAEGLEPIPGPQAISSTGHSIDTYESVDANTHKGVCSRCSDDAVVEPHSWLNGKCQKCGYVDETSVTYTVNIYKGSETDPEVKTVNFGTFVTVTAENKENLQFSNWAYTTDGDAVSTSKSYTFYVTKNMEVYAVYTENEEVEVKPMIVISNDYSLKAGSKNYVCFEAMRDIPTGYKLIEHGILYGTTMSTFGTTKEGDDVDNKLKFADEAGTLLNKNVKKSKASTTGMKGAFTLKANVGSNTTFYVRARGYMILENSDGNRMVVYSNVISRNYVGN